MGAVMEGRHAVRVVLHALVPLLQDAHRRYSNNTAAGSMKYHRDHSWSPFLLSNRFCRGNHGKLLA